MKLRVKRMIRMKKTKGPKSVSFRFVKQNSYHLIAEARMMFSKAKVRSVAGLVIPVSGSLVEVDILELLTFPCHVVGICHTSIGLGLMMANKLYLKLTLRGDKLIRNLGQTQSHPLSEYGCSLSNRSPCRLGIALMLNKDQKRY